MASDPSRFVARGGLVSRSPLSDLTRLRLDPDNTPEKNQIPVDLLRLEARTRDESAALYGRLVDRNLLERVAYANLVARGGADRCGLPLGCVG